MDQKPTLEGIITVGVQALLLITVLFLGNRWLGIPLVVNATFCLLLLTGVVARAYRKHQEAVRTGIPRRHRTASWPLPHSSTCAPSSMTWLGGSR